MSDLHRLVSSESEELILVDVDDNEVGYRSKSECHDGSGILHRAFSLFLFNDDGQLLLQQRAAGKRLWPGFWSNSCCSHPRRGESLRVAAQRRLNDELNISARLEYVYHFCYQARFGDAGAENELCHVFLGRIDGEARPNDSEIDSIQFLSASRLSAAFIANPEQFSPWFRQEWRELSEKYAGQLARYAI